MRAARFEHRGPAADTLVVGEMAMCTPFIGADGRVVVEIGGEAAVARRGERS